MTAPSAKPTKQVQENSLENSAHWGITYRV